MNNFGKLAICIGLVAGVELEGTAIAGDVHNVSGEEILFWHPGGLVRIPDGARFGGVQNAFGISTYTVGNWVRVGDHVENRAVMLFTDRNGDFAKGGYLRIWRIRAGEPYGKYGVTMWSSQGGQPLWSQTQE